jgi:hypothetical protein
MSNKDQNGPTGKSGQRNRKGEQRRQKSDPPKSPKLDQPPRPQPDQLQSLAPVQQPAAKERIDVVAMPADAAPIAMPPDAAPIAAAVPPDATPIAAAVPPDAAPIAAAVPAEAAPISLQAIANAYGDYTRKSFEDVRSFFEQLTGVRSPDKAVKLQTEFAKRAYETFVAESQKISELHGKLAKQSLTPWQGFVARTTRDQR